MLTGTVRGAAELLHVSPPAVSKLLATVERHTQLSLFERVKGRLVPTPEARLFFHEVDHLWKGVERLQNLSAHLADDGVGVLRLAISPGLAASLVPEVIQEVYRAYPALNVQVDLLIPHLLRDALVDGISDVGVALCPMEHPNLITVQSFECALVCVLPKGHPLESKRVLSAKDLAGQRLISFSKASAPNIAVASALEDLEINMELRSGPNACWFAQAGAGIAIVDSATVAGNAFHGVSVRAFRHSPKLDVAIQHSANRPLSRVARHFCKTFTALWPIRMETLASSSNPASSHKRSRVLS